MLVNEMVAKYENDYKREQLSRIYPKKRKSSQAKSVHEQGPSRPVFRLRKAWSA